MNDRLTTVLILLLRPYEKAWSWHIKRQYRKGKFKRPYGDPQQLGSTGAVVARRKGSGPSSLLLGPSPTLREGVVLP